MRLNSKVLETISGDFGNSFYLLDSKAFERNYWDLLNSFREYYNDTNIAYSYKTNYIPRFCKLVNSYGGFAEVVSDMEYQIAIKSGVPSRKIFFNGPYKSKAITLRLLLDGGIVNIDCLEELQLVLALAKNHRHEIFNIGLRCNFDLDDGEISRFGFDVTSNQFSAIVQEISQHNNVKLISLHCHFANRILYTWQKRTEEMINLYDKLQKESNHQLAFISLGGAIYGRMQPEMKAQFSHSIPSFTDYAKVAAKPFNSYFVQSEYNKPTLIIEPGTALVANSMKFVARVVSIKSVRGKYIATVGGSSYNISPNPNRKNVPITVYRPTSIATESQDYIDLDVAGYTCIETDYLYRGFSGQLAVGDFLVWDQIGAYSVVMKPPFILPNFPIVEYHDDDNSTKCIKRAETFEDIFQTYEF